MTRNTRCHKVNCMAVLLCLLATTADAGPQEATNTQDSRKAEETAVSHGAVPDGSPDEPNVFDLRSWAAASDPDALLAVERDELLLEVDANPDLDDDTVNTLREQILTGFPVFTPRDTGGALGPERGAGDAEGDNRRGSEPEGEFVEVDPDDYGVVEPGDLVPTLGLELEGIFHKHTFPEGSWLNSDCTTPGPCVLPAPFDIRPERIYLVWKAASFLEPVLVDHIAKYNGKSLRLYMQGLQLTQGAGAAIPNDFHVYPLASGCGPNQTDPCLVTVVESDAWFKTGQIWPTWNVSLELWETKQLSIPIFEFDQWGNPFPVYTEQVKGYSHAAAVIPNPNRQSFWTATIGASVISERCTTCHTMDTWAKINQRHNGIAYGPFLVDSLLVPNESVIHCTNCHEGFYYLGASSTFPENIWATPTPQLDINWAQIINDNPQTWPTEICQRMVTQLPSHAKREQHFHEDARLFWAVAKGELPAPGGGALPTAAPNDYGKFIERFDIWNDAGAPCP